MSAPWMGWNAFCLTTLLCFTAAPSSALPQAVPILERSPVEWPQVPADTWKGWDVMVPPPVAARPLLRDIGSAYQRGAVRPSLELLYELLDAVPDFPTALRQAGVIYFRLRRYGDAIMAFERYLAVAPHRVGDTRMLAHCYYSLGRYDEARAHYDRVLAIQPASEEALRGRGLAFMRLGESESALADLRAVLELNPKHGNAATWIAQILFDEEQVEAALAAALRGRDLSPFEPMPWFLLSQIYYELGQDEKGDGATARFGVLDEGAQKLSAIEGRLLYDPEQPRLYRQMYAWHEELGDHGGAQAVLLRWAKVEPRSLPVHIRILELAYELGDLKAGGPAAGRLWTLAGDDPLAWHALAEFYRRAGRAERAHEAAAELRRVKALLGR